MFVLPAGLPRDLGESFVRLCAGEVLGILGPASSDLVEAVPLFRCLRPPLVLFLELVETFAISID